KKALQNEFNNFQFARYLERYKFSKNTKVSRLARIDKMINRTDLLPSESLALIHEAYLEHGVLFLAEVLDFPMGTLSNPNQLKNKIAWKANGSPLSHTILQVKEISHE